MSNGRADYLALGDWNAICDMCGKKFKASMLKKRWDGAMVCEMDFETRHPQDFVRGVTDIQTPPWSRSPGPDTFLPLCNPNTITAYPGFAGAGCCMPGYINPLFDPTREY
jgi:hypothetical protein